jgi:DNA polymerase-1
MVMPEAVVIHSTYPRTYQGVPLYWARQIEKTKRLGYVETLAGRRVQVVGDWSRSSDRAWAMESTALNFPIQGVGADQKYLALAVMRSYLTEVGAYFAWDLHDGLYFFVPESKAKSFAVEGKRRLDSLPYKQAWGFTPPIPMPWDAHLGYSWGTLKGL